MTVYDSLGADHLITFYFSKTASNSWVVNGVVSASDALSGVDEIAYTKVLTFTTAGALDTEPTPLAADNDFDFAGGATQSQSIAIDFGDAITTDTGTGLLGTTQYGTTSAVFNQSQNGYSSGSLQRISIDSEGIVTGIFSNGSTSNVSQIALATFPNADGLGLAGKSLFIESNDSGQPLTGTPGSSGRGKIKSSALELSNVDLAAEFVKMITFQRGFQANSRVITMSDEVMNELVNIKR
jgi:flagellar hook protein FlgE